MTRAVFPGSFDPLTVGHLAVAEAAQQRLGLREVCLVLSVEPIGKDALAQLPVAERLDAIAAAAQGRPWLRSDVTAEKLLVDIAQGYDYLIVGADKAAQLIDPAYYGSEGERDSALERLPPLVVAPRPGGFVPEDAVVLELPEWVAGVSSTAVRSGRVEWKA